MRRFSYPQSAKQFRPTLHAHRPLSGRSNDELADDGYAYRYKVDERPLGEAEGAFLVCGFIVSRAYLEQGNAIESARWFERTRSACGPPGLFTEEFDVAQRQLRGNLPQAFVHAWLLECAALQQTPPE